MLGCLKQIKVSILYNFALDFANLVVCWLVHEHQFASMHHFARVDRVRREQLTAVQGLPGIGDLDPLTRMRVSLALAVHLNLIEEKSWNPFEVVAFFVHMALCGKLGPNQRVFRLENDDCPSAWQSGYFQWQVEHMSAFVVSIDVTSLEPSVLSTAMADLLHGRFFQVLLELFARSFEATWDEVERLWPGLAPCLALLHIDRAHLQSQVVPVKETDGHVTAVQPLLSLYPVQHLSGYWMADILELLAHAEVNTVAGLTQDARWHVLKFGAGDWIDDHCNVGVHNMPPEKAEEHISKVCTPFAGRLAIEFIGIAAGGSFIRAVQS